MSLIDVLDGVVMVVREKVAAPFGRRPSMGHYRRPNAAAGLRRRRRATVRRRRGAPTGAAPAARQAGRVGGSPAA
jgi:hypothetical protein